MILVIETSTTSIGVAVGTGREAASTVRHRGRPRHGELLAPTIEFCLAQAGVGMKDIDAIGVDAGPGLFTGLRVGVAAAKALGFALSRPVCVLNSLDILAWPLRWWPGTVVAALDGRKGQCFWAAYRRQGALWAPISGIGSGSPEDMAYEVGRLGSGVAFVGDAASRYGERIGVDGSRPVIGDTHPNPEAALELAALAVERGEGIDAMSVSALYLRAPDAKVSWKVERPHAPSGTAAP